MTETTILLTTTENNLPELPEIPADVLAEVSEQLARAFDKLIAEAFYVVPHPPSTLTWPPKKPAPLGPFGIANIVIC